LLSGYLIKVLLNKDYDSASSFNTVSFTGKWTPSPLRACLTTLIGLKEKDVKPALGVPKHLRFFALVYLGYPAKVLKPPKRRPVEESILTPQ
jgi:hypothetical protein